MFDVSIGIDFGTSNSCIAMYDTKPHIVPCFETGLNIIKSSIYSEAGEFIIGKDNIESINEIKKFLGKTIKEVLFDLASSSYKIHREENKFKILVGSEYFYPEELAAKILSFLKMQVELHLSRTFDILPSVISIPAYFNDNQRRSLLNACELANIKVLRLINEPTAAALAYGLEKNINNSTLIVYDLGGGTLDVSLLEIIDGTVEVLKTSGMAIGGSDFDNEIRNYCICKFIEKYNNCQPLNISKLMEDFKANNIYELLSISENDIENNMSLTLKKDIFKKFISMYSNIYKNKRKFRHLKYICEEAKKKLAFTKNVDIIYESFYDDKDLCISMSNVLLKDICKDLFKKCIMPITDILTQSNIKKEEISDVVLIGGGTRLLHIVEMLNELFPNKIRNNIDPEETVAIGGAIQAGIINQNTNLNALVLIDVVSQNIGVEIFGKKMSVVIKKNTQLPHVVKTIYTTVIDNQPNVTIKIFTGDSEYTQNNIFVGEIELNKLPILKKGEVKIEITFKINKNGIIKVLANEQKLNINKEVTLHTIN